jgi:hypothetical protein
VTRCRCRATVLLSHAGDGAVGVTWPRHDVDVESCWRWRCWGDLAAALHRCRVMLATVLSSHAGDGTTESTRSRHGVDVESS